MLCADLIDNKATWRSCEPTCLCLKSLLDLEPYDLWPWPMWSLTPRSPLDGIQIHVHTKFCDPLARRLMEIWIFLSFFFFFNSYPVNFGQVNYGPVTDGMWYIIIRQHSLYSLVHDSSDELKMCPMRKKLTICVFFLYFFLRHAKKCRIFFTKSVVFLSKNGQNLQKNVGPKNIVGVA